MDGTPHEITEVSMERDQGASQGAPRLIDFLRLHGQSIPLRWNMDSTRRRSPTLVWESTVQSSRCFRVSISSQVPVPWLADSSNVPGGTAGCFMANSSAVRTASSAPVGCGGVDGDHCINSSSRSSNSCTRGSSGSGDDGGCGGGGTVLSEQRRQTTAAAGR